MNELPDRTDASSSPGSAPGTPTHRPLAVRILMVVLAALPLVFLVYLVALISSTPNTSDLRKAKAARPSVVLSADGKELAVFKRANRDWVKLADMSPYVVAALIATEDHRFYEHHGMDLQRTAAALLQSAKGNLQGGSTITQQLARNLYPEDIGRALTINRKIKEAMTALKIEAVYSKPEILETYLNTVPFLYNAYGIEMAARTYFDKSADELDLLESATLIGMLKGTSYYNPVLNPERALQRRNTVLGQMVRHHSLPEAKLAALVKMPLKIEFERQAESPGPAPHLTQQLRRWLIEWADRNDYNIYADGLVLHTTLDSRLQDLAIDAVAGQANRLQKIADAEWNGRYGWTARTGPRRDLVLALIRDSKEYKAANPDGARSTENDEQAIRTLQTDAGFMQKLRNEKTLLQAGFLAMNPANGHVLAWVGSRDFTQDQFDHVSQARRQPGSTFKPFVYGAAFENGSRPNDFFVDRALEIPLGNGTVWRPSDAGGPSNNTMTLRDGLVYSKNTITAQVMQTVGPVHVARLARALGVRQSSLDQVPSLALGTSPVTLKEMVTGYSSIANEGRYTEPMMVTRVADRNGKVLQEFEPRPAETGMEPSIALTLLDVMRGVVDRGTGAAIRSRFAIRADVAGKTGTTQSNTDGWFILMHPQVVAGAWVGFNDNRITMGNAWGPGGQSALPMVGAFFQRGIKAGLIDQRERFAKPPQPPVLVDPGFASSSGHQGEMGSGSESIPPPEPWAALPPGYGENTVSQRGVLTAPPIRYVTVVQTPQILQPAPGPGEIVVQANEQRFRDGFSQDAASLPRRVDPGAPGESGPRFPLSEMTPLSPAR